MTTSNTKLDLTKTAYEAAKVAGEADGLTYAAWRAKVKQSIVPVAEVIVPAEPIVQIEQIDVPAEVVAQAEQMDVVTVTAEVTAALDTLNQLKPVVTAQVAASKSKLAQAIFVEELAKQKATGILMVRKNVIQRFIKEAGCTPKGANTYYQNIRNSHGLVVHKA